MPNNTSLPAGLLEEMLRRGRKPLTFTGKYGQPVFVPFIVGGAEDGDAGAGNNEDGSAGGDANANAGEGGGGNDGNNKDDGDDVDELEDHEKALPENVKDILRKNRKAQRDAERRAEAAEKAAAEAAGKVKEYSDRDKTELEKATERAEELEKQNAELQNSNKILALRSAFLAENGTEWHNAEDALDLALRRGLSDLEINKNGGVDRRKLKAIITELAKEKPYLVKSGDAGGTGGDGGKPNGPSGGSFNNGGNSGKSGASEADIARKYPAMAGRRRTK